MHLRVDTEGWIWKGRSRRGGYRGVDIGETGHSGVDIGETGYSGVDSRRRMLLTSNNY